MPVGAGDEPVRVDLHDPDRGMFVEQPEPFLAAPQCLLRLPPPGDVVDADTGHRLSLIVGKEPRGNACLEALTALADKRELGGASSGCRPSGKGRSGFGIAHVHELFAPERCEFVSGIAEQRAGRLIGAPDRRRTASTPPTGTTIASRSTTTI